MAVSQYQPWGTANKNANTWQPTTWQPATVQPKANTTQQPGQPQAQNNPLQQYSQPVYQYQGTPYSQIQYQPPTSGQVQQWTGGQGGVGGNYFQPQTQGGTVSMQGYQPPSVQAVPSGAPQQFVGADDQVLAAAQQAALRGFQTPTLDMTSARTQQFLTDPSLGYNPAKNRQAQLEGYDVNQAAAYEQARQAAGPMAAGLNVEKMAELALKGGVDRAQLANQLDEQAYERMRENYLASLTEGRATSEQERQTFGTNISALAQVKGLAEPAQARQFTAGENAITRGMEFAKATQNQGFALELTNLDAKVKQGLQLNEQDFAAAQAQLDKQYGIVKQSNDINAARQLLDAQLAFDEWKTSSGYAFTADQEAMNRFLKIGLQSNDQDFQKELLDLEQKNKMGLLLTEQDYDAAKTSLEQQFKMAQQNNDISGQMAIQQAANELEAWKKETDVYTQTYLAEQDWKNKFELQTKDFGQEEKMKLLDETIAKAKSEGDYKQQVALLAIKHTQDLESLGVQQLGEVELANIRGGIEMAIKQGDYANAEALQKAELTYRVNKDTEDRVLENLRLQMQDKGLDSEINRQQYEQIADQEEKGLAPAGSALNFLKTSLKNAGVDTSGINLVDQQAQANKALAAKYEQMKTQFGMTHQDMVEPVYDRATNTTTTRLTEKGQIAFNEYFNETMYGEESSKTKAAKAAAEWTKPEDRYGAAPGEKIKIESGTYTDLRGTKMPPGEYEVQPYQAQRGDAWTGKYTETGTDAVNKATGVRYPLTRTKGERGKTNMDTAQSWLMPL